MDSYEFSYLLLQRDKLDLRTAVLEAKRNLTESELRGIELEREAVEKRLDRALSRGLSRIAGDVA